MNPIIRNVLAVIAGLVVGSGVNMGIIVGSGLIIAMPEGVDPTNAESIKASMHLFQPQHFIAPFLAHAVGTLVGALTAAFIAASRKSVFAMVIGAFFLVGGIVNFFMISLPLWFGALDLILAYIPMGWLGGKLAGGRAEETA